MLCQTIYLRAFIILCCFHIDHNRKWPGSTIRLLVCYCCCCCILLRPHHCTDSFVFFIRISHFKMFTLKMVIFYRVGALVSESSSFHFPEPKSDTILIHSAFFLYQVEQVNFVAHIFSQFATSQSIQCANCPQSKRRRVRLPIVWCELHRINWKLKLFCRCRTNWNWLGRNNSGNCWNNTVDP